MSAVCVAGKSAAQARAPAVKAPSIFEKLGGRDVITTAVNSLYAKLITDPRISLFFAGVDMHTLKLKQVYFMQYAFGGSREYTGKDLGEAHAQLVRERGMLPVHFDIVAEHFQHTLQELGVPQDVVANAISTIAQAKPVIFPPELLLAARTQSDGSDSDFDDPLLFEPPQPHPSPSNLHPPNMKSIPE